MVEEDWNRIEKTEVSDLPFNVQSRRQYRTPLVTEIGLNSMVEGLLMAEEDPLAGMSFPESRRILELLS